MLRLLIFRSFQIFTNKFSKEVNDKFFSFIIYGEIWLSHSYSFQNNE